MANAGVGVFAVRRIPKGPHLFMGGNEEMRWISEDTFSRQPKPIRKLYKDFAVLRNGKYDAP
jgi:hypothetical protein